MKLKYLVLLAVSGTIIALDQLTKHLILQKFRLGETLPLIHNFFDLTYVRNTGAAFGLLAKWDPALRIPFFIAVPVVALGIIFLIFRKLEDSDLKLASALSLVIGGAFGNLIDRAAYNYVIDFLLFHWNYRVQFPAFNVADAAITIGVGLLLLDMFQKERLERRKQAENASNPV